MTAVSKIQQYIDFIRDQRVAWLREKPKVPKPTSDDPEQFLSALRDEYRWYMEQRDRLIKARNAIGAMIEDCEMSMDDIQYAAGLMDEISEKARMACRYADKADAELV